MLRYLIGYEVLKESLKEFLYMPKDLPHNQTSTKEFVSLINENTGKDLNWFFNHYLYKADLPILKMNQKKYKNKVYIDIWWDNDGFKMPLDIVYSAFDGSREKRLDLNNSPKRIVIPEGSTLSLDPDKNILFEVLELN